MIFFRQCADGVQPDTMPVPFGGTQSSRFFDRISFATTHNSYYVLAEQETDSDNPGSTGVKTGDNTNLMLWLLSGGGAIAALMALVYAGKRKQQW